MNHIFHYMDFTSKIYQRKLLSVLVDHVWVAAQLQLSWRRGCFHLIRPLSFILFAKVWKLTMLPSINSGLAKVNIEMFRNNFFFIPLLYFSLLNPLSASFAKWPNTLKQFVSNFPTNCLSVFGRFVGLALKGLSVQFDCICQ